MLIFLEGVVKDSFVVFGVWNKVINKEDCGGFKVVFLKYFIFWIIMLLIFIYEIILFLSYKLIIN